MASVLPKCRDNRDTSWEHEMKKILGLAALAAGAIAPVTASSAATVQLDSRSFDGTNWVFTYGGTLAPTEGVENGSKLVILDFAGYVDGSISSALASISTSIEMSSAALGYFPGITDDPSIPNLVFTYTGASFQVSPAPAGGYTPIDFTGLSALTTLSGVTTDGFSAYTVNNSRGGVNGTDVYSTGSLLVPSAVPEPATWAMMLIGFGVAGYSMRRRNPLTLSFS